MSSLDGLFEGQQVTDDGSLVPACPLPPDTPRPSAREQFLVILPGASVELTAEQARQIQRHQQARQILGAAEAAPMRCDPGCPTAFRCPLAVLHKAPTGHDCPFEIDYVRTRFAAWMDELGVTLHDILESERAAIASLVYIDVQEQRCLAILAKAENAHMTARSVRDVDENGNVVCWEDVVHINRQILEGLHNQRRGLMKDFELTPEAKTKKRKLEGPRPGSDLSSRMADNLDKLRQAQRRPITVKATPISS